MKKVICAICLKMVFAAAAFQACAQGFEPVTNQENVQEPDKEKNFNAGGSIGFAGIHWFFNPVAEVKFKQTSLRLTPGIFFVGAALEQEFEWKTTARLHLISKGAKTNFVLSGQYQHQYRSYCPDECNTSNRINMAGLLAGLKSYKGRHFQYLKIGVLAGRTKKYGYNDFGLPDGLPQVSNWVLPFGEYGWGIYLFKN